MNYYKRMYLVLFNAASDALAAMEQQNYGLAMQFLRRAQQDAEEIYLTEGEEPAS